MQVVESTVLSWYFLAPVYLPGRIQLLKHQSATVLSTIIFVTGAAISLTACGDRADYYPRAMWDGQRYDVGVPVAELYELGWRCARQQFGMDLYDASCTASPGSEAAKFLVFGIPQAASTIFLAEGALKGINVSIHAGSAIVLANHLKQEFGKPTWYESRGGCRLVWTNHNSEYMLDMDDRIEDGYVTLYIEVGGFRSSQASVSAITRFIAALRGTKCGRAS